MFNLDLRRAETALKAGRLDDAFRILSSSREVRHASGQRLIDQLIDALLKRSQQHFDQEHFQQARRDAELAEKLGGHQLKVAELIRQVNAKDRSIAGRASRLANDAIASEIAQLVADGNHEIAIAKYQRLRDQASLSPETKSLVDKTVNKLIERAESELLSGRLDRCEVVVQQLISAGFAEPRLQEMKLQLERCYNVSRAIEQYEYGVAIRELRLLDQVLPAAAWIGDMIQSLQICADRIEQIKSGPFGLLGQQKSAPVARARNAKKLNWNQKSYFVSSSNQQGRFNRNASVTSMCSVLQVDRLGSLLLVQGDVCSVGGPTTSGCDVAIQTDGVKDRIKICRDGEDYFAISNTPFFVNELLADRHLLVDGDTIHVGVRGRLKFCKPMPASNSVVLQITGSKLKRRDIRSIVLVDDAVVFGKQVGHFRLADSGPPLILRATADSKGEFLIHQKGSDQQQLLSDGASLQINNCHFALASAQSMGGVS